MEDSLVRYITTISKYINYYINKKANEFNLNIKQVHILRILYNNEGINQEELSDIFKTDKVTISKLLSGLVKEGYVEKKKNEADKRVKNLYVTKKGKNIKKEINDILKSTTEILSSGFTEKENAVIRKLLNQMLENIYEEINLEI
ncbi:MULTISPECIES: MarR family winged helix-turn-helix transcriptional regulator [unclassified Halanaerobium]|uniref:MarR family winged helix-turn-helix transcriptional regulator n=1 Tax=unclassified Halanaerobium TaxID=2641197 RepID=UPI000DF13C6A|nr:MULTISPECIES: MarR family transcriptional regulator [unclassified Halanaerobium]RCW47715.1 MarR family transcriptional regulator [Halanaerobium sp. MA284_MarDTE_T2]RCW84641.1 MarR family transcriptional regulator [Halanaerobium sp. DL-01]